MNRFDNQKDWYWIYKMVKLLGKLSMANKTSMFKVIRHTYKTIDLMYYDLSNLPTQLVYYHEDGSSEVIDGF